MVGSETLKCFFAICLTKSGLDFSNTFAQSFSYSALLNGKYVSNLLFLIEIYTPFFNLLNKYKNVLYVVSLLNPLNILVSSTGFLGYPKILDFKKPYCSNWDLSPA